MKTLLSEEELQEGIRRLAEEIRGHYDGRPLTIVGVLIGSVVLLADLIRLLDMPLRVGLVQARSYARGSTRPGPLAIDVDLLSCDVRGRDVLLVDDIFDTGNTLWELVPQIDDLGPTSVRTAVLLRKQGRAEVSYAARLRRLRHPRRVRRRLRHGLPRPATATCPTWRAEPGSSSEGPWASVHVENLGTVAGSSTQEEPRHEARPGGAGDAAVLAPGGRGGAGDGRPGRRAGRPRHRRHPADRPMAADWPAEITYRGVPVVRLPQPPLRFWGTLRYMQAVARWLRSTRTATTWSTSRCSSTTPTPRSGAVGGRVPVVLRAEGAGRPATASGSWTPAAAGASRTVHEGRRPGGPEPGDRAGAEGGRLSPRPRSTACPTACRFPTAASRGATERPRPGRPWRRPIRRWTARRPPRWPFTPGGSTEAKGLDTLRGRLAAGRRPAARRPALAGRRRPLSRGAGQQIEAETSTGGCVLAGIFDNVDELLAAADLFVLPSLEEGMSLALLEAMAAGLPVVATDIPGNRDLVTDGREALLVPVGDAAALAAAILRGCWTSRSWPPSLGAAARAAWPSEIFPCRAWRSYVELFESLVRNSLGRDTSASEP